MDISSHRGKIVLNAQGDPYVVFIIHHVGHSEDEPAPAIYFSLRKAENSSGIFKYFSQGANSVDDDPIGSDGYRKNYYRVFYRAQASPPTTTDDQWGMQLEWGGDSTNDGYMGIISGYNAPSFINTSGKRVIDTFYITAVTIPKRDPDATEPGNRHDNWSAAKLMIDVSKLPGYSANSTPELSYVPLSTFVEHHQNPKEPGSVPMTPTGEQPINGKFTYAGTNSRLTMGMYILTEPSPAQTSAANLGTEDKGTQDK